jgi:peptidoglycan/LPS O-acetylase OafA/YrhL
VNDDLRTRLERAPVPDADAATRRAWTAIGAAVPAPRRRRRRRALLVALALGGALAIGEPAAAIAAFACVGAGVAAFAPVVFRSAGSLPGIPPSVGLAALTTVGYSAFLVGPPAIGFLAEAVGLPWALSLAVAMLTITVALAPRVQPAGAPAPQPA